MKDSLDQDSESGLRNRRGAAVEGRCGINVRHSAHVRNPKNPYRFISDKAFTSVVTSILFPASQDACINGSEMWSYTMQIRVKVPHKTSIVSHSIYDWKSGCLQLIGKKCFFILWATERQNIDSVRMALYQSTPKGSFQSRIIYGNNFGQRAVKYIPVINPMLAEIELDSLTSLLFLISLCLCSLCHMEYGRVQRPSVPECDLGSYSDKCLRQE